MRPVPIISTSLACACVTLAAALPHTVTAQDPAPGEAIFRGKGNCFTCHGPEAKGTPLAPDLTDGDWVNLEGRPTQAEVEALVREGVSKPVQHPAPMPPMGGGNLSDEQVAQVAAYVLSLSADPEEGAT